MSKPETVTEPKIEAVVSAAVNTSALLAETDPKSLTTAEKKALKESESVAMQARTHVGGVRIAPDSAA